MFFSFEAHSVTPKSGLMSVIQEVEEEYDESSSNEDKIKRKPSLHVEPDLYTEIILPKEPLQNEDSDTISGRHRKLLNQDPPELTSLDLHRQQPDSLPMTSTSDWMIDHRRNEGGVSVSPDTVSSGDSGVVDPHEGIFSPPRKATKSKDDEVSKFCYFFKRKRKRIQ